MRCANDFFKPACLLLALPLFTPRLALAQSEPERVATVLREPILAPEVAVYQIKQYLLARVARPPAPASAREWDAQEKNLREHLLRDVIFHGWPEAWVNAPPKFEDLGVIEGGKGLSAHAGYWLRKLRYEIVPGFYSTAILYEPNRMRDRMPAILNVNGHVGPPGKAAEYKQKRCINFAKHGILALNLEWLGMGELYAEENMHRFGAHLDLVGAQVDGLFYLAMRRGLDYLALHPNVDPKRLGVTGLSGGGWQTIMLSALDERVAVSVPVAGYASETNIIEPREYGDLGDYEQYGTDLLDGQDFTHITAMRAPRPTLLINNAEDDCCYRGPIVRGLIFDAIRPVYRLYGREDDFVYHENRDPATHNYALDNRLAAYRFFSRHFGLPIIESEAPAGQEIKSFEELAVGLPKDNLTILGLARKMGQAIIRPPVPAEPSARAAWAKSERQKLRAVVRYKPATIARAWAVAITKNKGVETKSLLFEMGEGQRGLSANGVWLEGIDRPPGAPVTLILNDKGKKAAAHDVSDRVNRDEGVLALDLLFMGDAWTKMEPEEYAQHVAALGERPLGLEAAQLVAIARWAETFASSSSIRLEATGIRAQVVTLVAAALEPELFSEVVVHEGMPGLGFLLDAPVKYDEAPDLFCLDLYKEFDLDRLAAAAAPVKISTHHFVAAVKK